MYRIKEFYERNKEALDLTLIAGAKGVARKIQVPEAQRPGLSLAGALKYHASKRLIVLGRAEMEFLKELPSHVCKQRLQGILTEKTPAVVVARQLKPIPLLIEACEKGEIPLFRSSLVTMPLLSKLTAVLEEAFAPTLCCHGCLVEVFGVGVLIQGESSVGKSEAALGLIEKGHRLVSDDVVKVKRKEGAYLEGRGVELSRHHMEVRGIGIINVAHIYGAVCVREKKSVDIVVRLEVWDERHFYDRLGIEENTTEILGVKVPFHVLPVKPGRDVVLLLETLALNHRLKKMGFHSAKEFQQKLLSTISQKNKRLKVYDKSS